MASGPYFDPRRGSWAVQWHDGRRWRRTVVIKRRPGWKPEHGRPKKTPPEALAAVLEYADRERAARRSRHVDPARTVEDFLETYRSTYTLDHAAGSARELTKAVRLFLAWCQASKVGRLEQVTPTACRRWIEDRAREQSQKTGRPISYARLKQERALLAAAWARAVRHEEVPSNPWLAVEVPARPTRTAKGSWTPEEFARLCEAARPWLRDILILGAYTGLRISALLAMEWSWVELARPDGKGFGWVAVPIDFDKAHKGYRVPIARPVHDLLFRRQIHHRRRDHDRVLSGQSGRPATAGVVGTAILRACARAGLAKPSSPNHHLRRTFGRWAVLGHLTGRPVPLYVASRWMGHGNVATTERYLDLHLDDSSAWMEEHEPGSGER